MFILIFCGVIIPIAMAIFYGMEQHDKVKRKQQGLPTKRYHDITDVDFTYTSNIGRRK